VQNYARRHALHLPLILSPRRHEVIYVMTSPGGMGTELRP